jgi:hypothetical protein
MSVTVLDNGWISDVFQFESAYGTYQDAIVMPAEEYNALSPEDIISIKQDRFNTWLTSFGLNNG